jgi:diadenosine tetraphosphate (Ap4A) HIT family hydrolase
MNDLFKEFQEKFKIAELSIIQTNYWTWSVRPIQCTLGAGVISLNRHCRAFSQLDDLEYSDLGLMIQIVENTISTIFASDKINYLMLMMVDEHVHFHMIPRYKEGRQFGGLAWNDNGWPSLPNLGDNAERSDMHLLGIIRTALEQQNS